MDRFVFGRAYWPLHGSFVFTSRAIVEEHQMIRILLPEMASFILPSTFAMLLGFLIATALALVANAPMQFCWTP